MVIKFKVKQKELVLQKFCQLENPPGTKVKIVDVIKLLPDLNEGTIRAFTREHRIKGHLIREKQGYFSITSKGQKWLKRRSNQRMKYIKSVEKEISKQPLLDLFVKNNASGRIEAVPVKISKKKLTKWKRSLHMLNHFLTKTNSFLVLRHVILP